MPLPFRNNPKITAIWKKSTDDKMIGPKTKRAYYDISTSVEPGRLVILFREEKKRLGGSAEKTRNWFAHLRFDLDSTFARDLKMFLNNYVEGDAPEVEKKEKDDN